jgi:hypothetical protein
MFDLCPMATNAPNTIARRFTDKDALDKAERASVLRVQ